MIRLNSIFCVLFLALVCSPAAADEDIFKIGVEALNKKDYYFAVACFDDVFRHDSKSAQLYFLRAQAYQGRKDWDKAIKDLNEVIRLDPKMIEEVNPRLADVYTDRGN